jgi:hypothetical protein
MRTLSIYVHVYMSIHSICVCLFSRVIFNWILLQVSVAVLLDNFISGNGLKASYATCPKAAYATSLKALYALRDLAREGSGAEESRQRQTDPTKHR